jgi:hypothetical protein
MKADEEEEIYTRHGGICWPRPLYTAGKRSSVPTDYCTAVFILYSETFSGPQCWGTGHEVLESIVILLSTE